MALRNGFSNWDGVSRRTTTTTTTTTGEFGIFRLAATDDAAATVQGTG